jgi:hypothetical protein
MMQAGTFPARRCPSNVTARMPWRVRIGLALILTGMVWFGGWTWWESTRIWVPLDIPISLSAGHIRTPEFEVNVESKYGITVYLERAVNGEDGLCLGGPRVRLPANHFLVIIERRPVCARNRRTLGHQTPGQLQCPYRAFRPGSECLAGRKPLQRPGAPLGCICVGIPARGSQ